MKNVEDIYLLSPTQQGILFHTLHQPNSGVYVEQLHATIHGYLNIEAFKKAWLRAIKSNSQLKTAVYWEGLELPIQVVKKEVEITFAENKWSKLPKEEQTSRVSKLLNEDRLKPFNFSSAPIMRFYLIEMDSSLHHFIWSFHHILMDGWSYAIVLKDVFACYEALCKGVEPDLKETKPYREYISWLKKQDSTEVERFWRKELAGFAPTPLLPKPFDNSYAEETHDNIEIALSEKLTSELRMLGRANHLTLNTIVQGTWAILLSRYAQVKDIVFGVTHSGRTPEIPGIESMVGLFINTLPMRVEVLPESQLLPWLKNLQLNQAELRRFEYSSLIKVQEWGETPKGLSLFESIIVFENYPVEVKTGANSDLKVTNVKTYEKLNYPLALIVIPSQTMVVRAMLDTRKLNSDTVERMLGHLETLLQAVVDNPGSKLSNLPILTDSERHKLLIDWNDTQVVYPQDKCIHQLFEEQVRKSPKATAVVFEEQSLSYEELDQRANQLAHYLISKGVKPDTLVGICVERSVEMIVGLLSILKAGGAYVPIDPTYPQERIAFTLTDAQVPILLTQEHLVAGLPAHKAHVVCLDSDWPRIAEENFESPVSGANPANLAYVIYTSGSTGKPKGVMISHLSLHNRLVWMQDTFQITSTDRVLQKTAFSFDVSVWEFFWTLSYGATLVIAKPGGAKDSNYLCQLIQDSRVTIVHFVPSMLESFLGTLSDNLSKKNSLRLVVCSGEVLSPTLKSRFLKFMDAELYNLYGPTEASIDVTFWACKNDRDTVPIGRPIANTQIYILDAHQNPLPIGVPGELHIGGAGLARGYLNRPDLTAEKFIPNPFNSKLSERLYKTGDLGRYLPDGNIEFLGRIDHQVKIRGFRIEPGEIEAALLEHDSVQEVVVLALGENFEDKRLVAYLVFRDDGQPTINELREHLKAKLPDYMVPAAFVFLDALPLTPNGKVDRKALPEPDTSRPALEEAYVAPRTPVEKVLADIWAEVLGVEQVGVHDNFFDLGGDSIKSMQVMSLARKEGVEFTLQQLFSSQTISHLGRMSQDTQNLNKFLTTSPYTLISKDDLDNIFPGIEDAYPLSKLQTGMIFHSELDPRTAIYHDIFSFHLRMKFDQGNLLDALQELIEHHPILRTSFDISHFSEALQLVHEKVEVPIEFKDLLGLQDSLQEEQIDTYIELEKKKGFDWSKPPLFRVALHQRSASSLQFTLSFHHSILDGWSVASLLTELITTYTARINGTQALRRPPLTVSFSDYVKTEIESVRSTEHREFWLTQLQGSNFTKFPQLAPKQLEDKDSTREIGVLEENLSPQLLASVKNLAHIARASIKSVLLTAHLRVMSYVSGQTDVVTGLVTNVRPEEHQSEQTLGLFLNTLPFRAQLKGGTWLQLIREVFETEKKILPHRWYPLSEIQREAKRKDLFETAFNFVHFHVYDKIAELKNLEALGGKFFQETNFAFLAQFNLNLSGSGARIHFEYDRQKLSHEQSKDIATYYIKALETMCDAPGSRYDPYLPLSTGQLEFLNQLNDTQVVYPQDKCIHQLFEEQVRKSPKATAVVFEEQSLSYEELDQRANQLAHYLISKGVKPDTLVGICVERSVEMIVGLLSILKAGGAYVPIDPTYPQERIAFTLTDAQVPILLTQEHLVAGLPAHKAHVVCLDSDWPRIAEENFESPVSGANPANLAYVIYTSGSTGKPKGVMIEHHTLVNLCTWHTSKHNNCMKILHYAPLTFDVSIYEIIISILIGRTLYVVKENLRTNIAELANFIYKTEIEKAVLPVTLLHVISQEFIKNSLKPKSLKEIITTGEQLKLTKDIRELLQKLDCQLHNHYGPSETHVVTAYDLATDTREEQSYPPIGRPIANTQIYILDAHQNPLPIGVPGELHIGGAGLARGYLNRPDLTAEKFIPNPFNSKLSERLYKTGDLGRYLPDGNIEFLGRIDHQVKIRGFRIEPGEIEAALLEHDSVQEVVVLALGENFEDKRLVAYLVFRDDGQPTINELREHLKAKLPDYMVPAAFVFLDALPLTPNGKVDRKALPEPDTSRPALEEAYVAPRTPVEKVLADIWAEVLGVEQVGVHDNFFDLGGDSLLATRLISRLRDTFQIDLPLKVIFDSPTLVNVSTYIVYLKATSVDKQLTEKILSEIETES